MLVNSQVARKFEKMNEFPRERPGDAGPEEEVQSRQETGLGGLVGT